MAAPVPRSSIEIERKYEVAHDAVLPEAGGAGFHVARESVDRLDAVYFDTEDERLAAAGVVLRRRTGGHDAGWHVKLPAATGRRELHLPGDDAAIPEQFRRLLRDHSHGAPLTPLARLETTRRSVVLVDADGRAAIELAEDTVHATALRSGDVSDWREWEAEALPGAPADALDRLQPLLLAAGARPAASASKLAQALGRSRLATRAPSASGAAAADGIRPQP